LSSFNDGKFRGFSLPPSWGTVLEQKPLTLSVPLREDPPGVLRVGKSRVLLELVIRAYQRGASPVYYPGV